eukprot:TRINITY_DN973_c0_g1_i2.p1 TRINITY_DN973_c0_g1~~TRINITY_DN973_c0_g1_i2.p1  ORF type:complete len:235 (+),score=58.65 TRINITY_DN973_c0_g1_i2:217-921(+)
MNDAEVGRQVQQMVQFIRQEAEEKANEIILASEEEFNIEKLQLVEAEKQKIRKEFERKEKQVETRKKIEYSTQLNVSRLKLLQAQDDIVRAMKSRAERQLISISDDPQLYQHLLKGLILQGLVRLREPAVNLRCREIDLPLVEEVMQLAIDEYVAISGVPVPPDVYVDRETFLPPPPTGSDDDTIYCSGGVLMGSRDWRIVCSNTLDARLDIAFKQNLPDIRKKLFGMALYAGA